MPGRSICLALDFMTIGATRPLAAQSQIGRRGRLSMVLSALACAAVVTSTVQAAEPAAVNATLRIQSDQVQQTGGGLYTFYAARGYRPLWLDGQGAATPAVGALLDLLRTAEYDGIAPASLNLRAVEAAIEESSASRSVADLTRAELLLSSTFVAYVQALRSPASAPMIYEHGNLRPQPIPAYHLLNEAALASSVLDYVEQMKWMHPLYASLRRSLGAAGSAEDRLRQATISSLSRIRGIPNFPRHVLVDVASARLWMYENGRPVDSMRVVVGKPTTRTPFLAGYIRYAITNPYWNVPPEMVSQNIASNVLGRGVPYLKAGGYQVLSDWSDAPKVVDPRTVDWRAAKRGELDLRVRQLPTAGNFMGKAKFEFPNPQGIYLHDTPQKDLMRRDARQLSGGCIRLEDAQRLGRWLMGRDLPAGDSPENKIDLPEPIPIYITYLTAEVDQGEIALGPDPYGLDPTKPSLAAGKVKSDDHRLATDKAR